MLEVSARHGAAGVLLALAVACQTGSPHVDVETPPPSKPPGSTMPSASPSGSPSVVVGAHCAEPMQLYEGGCYAPIECSASERQIGRGCVAASRAGATLIEGRILQVEGGMRAPVEGFYADDHAVRVVDYRACVAAGACRATTRPMVANWGGAGEVACNLGSGPDDASVTCVDFEQATRFCAWRGKRLPTEVEWLLADAINGKRDPTQEPRGEWTADAFAQPFAGGPPPDEYGPEKVVREGARDRYAAEPTAGWPHFRCVADGPSPGPPDAPPSCPATEVFLSGQCRAPCPSNAAPAWQSPLSESRTVMAAGEFVRGCVPKDAGCAPVDAGPVRTTLDAFSIDDVPVLVRDYRRCVEAGGCQAEGTASEGVSSYRLNSQACPFRPGGDEDAAMTCVTWSQASDYCHWRGGRLPSDAEWDRVMRTSSATVQLPNRVNEWVLDLFTPSIRSDGHHNPRGPADGVRRVARGPLPPSKVLALDSFADLTTNRPASRRGNHPDLRSADVGFRCVDAKTPASQPPRAARADCTDLAKPATARAVTSALHDLLCKRLPAVSSDGKRLTTCSGVFERPFASPRGFLAVDALRDVDHAQQQTLGHARLVALSVDDAHVARGAGVVVSYREPHVLIRNATGQLIHRAKVPRPTTELVDGGCHTDPMGVWLGRAWVDPHRGVLLLSLAFGGSIDACGHAVRAVWWRP
jgi:formylglycine-generating enzyme required for sulfatase activity